MTSDQVTAIVLGGHDIGKREARKRGSVKDKDALELPAHVASKALLDYHGKPIVSYVLDALVGCPQISQIIYVGTLTANLEPQVHKCVPAGQRLLDSLQAGLQHVALDTSRILAVAADLPWLSTAAIDDLLTAASGFAATYPVIPKTTMQAHFPKQVRTYARLQDAEVTGGNAFVFSKAALPRVMPFVERAYRHRKNPLFLAQLTGVDAVVRYLLGKLSLVSLEARASYLLDLPAHVQVSSYPSLAADVDKASHLHDE